MGAPELRVVVVVMVVRAAPHAARAKHVDSKDPHQHFREERPGQNRVVLLVVVNDEEPQDQQPGQNTAGHLGGRVNVPKRACQRGQQERAGRKHMAPAPERLVLGEGLGRQNELIIGSQSGGKIAAMCDRVDDRFSDWDA